MSPPDDRVRPVAELLQSCATEENYYDTTYTEGYEYDEEYYDPSAVTIRKTRSNVTVKTEDNTGQAKHAATGHGKGDADITKEEASEPEASDLDPPSDCGSDPVTAKVTGRRKGKHLNSRPSHSPIYRKIFNELKNDKINENSWAKYLKEHKKPHHVLERMREAVETKIELKKLKEKGMATEIDRTGAGTSQASTVFSGADRPGAGTSQASTVSNGTDRLAVTLNERKLIEWLRHHKVAKQAFTTAVINDGDLSKYLQPFQNLQHNNAGSQSPRFEDMAHFKVEHARVSGLIFQDWYEGKDISEYMAPIHSSFTGTISPYINNIAKKLGYEDETQQSNDGNENENENEDE